MRKIDAAAASRQKGSDYPPPFDGPCRARVRHALGEAAGLTQFGVNLQRLPPGAWSSQRHWHTAEDEFVWVLEGEVGEDIVEYPDIDLQWSATTDYAHKGGTRY